MSKRLPPGEAERRAAKRHRATFSGEKYQRYNPELDGYGSYQEWASAASAFLNGDVEYAIESDAPASSSSSATTKKTNTNPNLAALDMDEMPINLAALTKGYRGAVMAAFRASDSKDTAPEYVNAFMKMTRAFDLIKRQRGW